MGDWKQNNSTKGKDEREVFAVFAPVGNESPTVNNEGVDRTATTIATETHVTVFSEAQSLVQPAMSLNLLSPRYLDGPSENSASLSNNKYKPKRGAIKILTVDMS